MHGPSSGGCGFFPSSAFFLPCPPADLAGVGVCGVKGGHRAAPCSPLAALQRLEMGATQLPVCVLLLLAWQFLVMSSWRQLMLWRREEGGRSSTQVLIVWLRSKGSGKDSGALRVASQPVKPSRCGIQVPSVTRLRGC
jgi:hypothetical protein